MSPSAAPPAAPSGPLPAPRILCLQVQPCSPNFSPNSTSNLNSRHGGGTNAAIFRFQLRGFLARSSNNFRFVFVEAPFLSPPHSAVAQVFADFAPFRRWLRFEREHAEIDDMTAASEILGACREAMETDDKDGATGEWVGVLGFSQGAKIAASLLWAQQILAMRPAGSPAKKPLLNARFKFGVLMAGRYPIVNLSADLPDSPYTSPAGRLFSEVTDMPESNSGEHVVMLPTIHVHGLKDPGLEQHRKMRDLWFATGTARLVEWDGDHRLPVRPVDVDNVLERIYDLAEQAGVEIARKDDYY